MSLRSLSTSVLVMGVLLLAGCGSSSSSSSASSKSSTKASPATEVGPEGVPLEQGSALAAASSTTSGATVDGVQCAPIEQLAYHIHAHLQVYVDGQPRQLPPAIGLVGPVAQQTARGTFYAAQTCYFWLHTHASDGIIHIESPTRRIYTLGAFFDEWRQPLSAKQVGSAIGPVSAFINGNPWTRDPRSIPLQSHSAVQLDVGTPVVPFQSFSFANTGL